MKAKRIDEVQDLIAEARRELNPTGGEVAEGKIKGHPVWGPVTCALNEAMGEIYRLKAKLGEIAKTAAREAD